MKPTRKSSTLGRWLFEPDAAGLGLDFRPGHVAIARASGPPGRPEVHLCFQAALPPGAASYSMVKANLPDPAQTRRFLAQKFAEAGIEAGRIALTLPDTVARVTVQELPDAPRARKEIEDLLRFHLRKSLPFDADQARVSFNRLSGEPASFLTGVVLDDVASQYEETLESLGFQVGIIETSTLSLLNLWKPVAERSIAPETDYFFLNLEEDYFTVALVRRCEAPVLIRTLGRRSAAGPDDLGSFGSLPRYGVDELVGELVPTVIYYQEKIKGRLAHVYYRSVRHDLGDLQPVLESQFEAPAEPFDLQRAVSVSRKLNVDEPLGTLVAAAAGAAVARAA